MNREQRLNRAKDKTPKAQRVGNFFVKVKQGARQQCTNVVPYSKLYNTKTQPGLFATYWDIFKAKFGM